MKFGFVFFIVCAGAVRIQQVENTLQCKAGDGICKQMCAVDEEDTGSCCNINRCCQPRTCNDTILYAQCKARNGENKPMCEVNEQDTGIGPFCNDNRCCEPTTCIDEIDCNCKVGCDSEKEREDQNGLCCKSMKCCKTCNDTRQCKAEGGICKQTCAVDEEDTGPCCRHSYRCCQTPTCNDSLQYAQCKAKHGESKPVCNVNEQDTGIGPFCNENRCCEPPTCIAKVDCNCKSPGFRCYKINEYLDIAGNCSGSNTCCKPCCLTCGGTFNGPEGSFTSPNYPSYYCNNHICRYTIKVEEGSKVMLNFTFFYLEPNMWGDFTDTVQVYDGEISTATLMATLDGGPFEGLEFNSTSNKMTLIFKSDYIGGYPGLSAIYKTLK
ncbi:Hypothetical predicted protein [Mytilus galloprovincialis]|nr:Hypothetical predicted protein [Mytilus galloprovincialis]